MPANFPGSDPTLTDSFTDGVDDVEAADANQTAMEVNAIGAFLREVGLHTSIANIQTLSGTKTLTDADSPLQILDCGGSDREVDLAPEASTNHLTVVVNASGAANNLNVYEDSGSTLKASVAQGEFGVFLSDGTDWYGNIIT